MYHPGTPATWHIASTAGFFDIATTPLMALSLIGADVNRNEQHLDDGEFSVRWINTPEGFRSPQAESVPEIASQELVQ